MGFKDAGKPHYLGHRERLRRRFRDAGADAVPDYELLELILFRAAARHQAAREGTSCPLRHLRRSGPRPRNPCQEREAPSARGGPWGLPRLAWRGLARLGGNRGSYSRGRRRRSHRLQGCRRRSSWASGRSLRHGRRSPSPAAESEHKRGRHRPRPGPRARQAQ